MAARAPIVLGAVFCAVVTPMGLIMRTLGHDPLRRRFEPQAESYRVAKQARPGHHMTRQF